MSTEAYQHTTSRGTTLFLNKRVNKSKSGKETTMYFFSKTVKDPVATIPEGYEVTESGPMAILRRVKVA